ncbi:solute carrier family 2, facilitated glucose transporter member 5-like [Clavelina lepadiformis]|uniref:solute carrier family 2, facilitated glucose transporter member 5-like n=1 Tax=Clavelina lepadiformis TaxID=159417 RepID=UPI004041A06C
MAETNARPAVTAQLVLAVFTAGLSSFQYGFNMAILDVKDAAQVIQLFIGLKQRKRIPVTLNVVRPSESCEEHGICRSNDNNVDEGEICLDSNMPNQWYFALCVYTIGGFVGSAFSANLVQRLGRKKALLATNHFSIFAAVLMIASKSVRSMELIICARTLQGLHAGLTLSITPLYVGEISHKSVRGGVITAHQLCITVGLLTAQVLGLSNLLGTPDSWNLLLAFPAVMSILQLLILPFLPDSPRSLLIDKNIEKKAKESLRFFLGTENVEDEVNEIKEEAESENNVPEATIQDLMEKKELCRKLIPLGFMQVVQQLCGINAILFYVKCIVIPGGDQGVAQKHEQILVAVFNVVMTIVPVILIDRVGRKQFLVTGYVIAAFFTLLMALLFYFPDSIVVAYLRIGSVPIHRWICHWTRTHPLDSNRGIVHAKKQTCCFRLCSFSQLDFYFSHIFCLPRYPSRPMANHI